MKMEKVILTGIKPTGELHLGNYCGAIKPMIEFVNGKKEDETIYMFIADIHALNGGLPAKDIREFSYSAVATYLACGLDPQKVVIFRQSAVRQHAELGTLLTNVTPKGMMNRATAYKAAVDKSYDEIYSYKNVEEFYYNSPEYFTNILSEIDKQSELDDINFKIKCLTNQGTDKNNPKLVKLFEQKNNMPLINEEIYYSIYLQLLLSEPTVSEYREILNEYSAYLPEDVKELIQTGSDEDFLKELYYISALLKERKKQIDIIKKHDAGINMGLYTYPILMAADILLYQSNVVPVGYDQRQHIEMARDIASTFNSRYSDTFTLPEYDAEKPGPEIKGLDGRKMSKSYNNHIPIFCEENELKSKIKKIETDSAKPEEPKENVEGMTIYQLYKLFATEEQSLDFKTRLEAGGFGYGDAKQELFEVINNYLKPKREEYNRLMSNRKELDAILEENEAKAARVAEKTIRKVKKKMGLVQT